MICRHCNLGPVSRPRGLCWNCYYAPNVRESYPVTSKFGRRGVRDFRGKARPVGKPTQATPGSEEKIQVLMRRAELRQDLFHPNDSTLHGPTRRMRIVRVAQLSA